MFKPDRNFKMPKKFKLMLRLMKGSDEKRSLWKKSFIQAALAEEEFRKAKFVKEKGE